MSRALSLPSANTQLVDRVIVTRHGERIFDFDSGRHREPVELMSVTKSIVALSVCKLVELGLLRSLDVPVFEIYPEWNQGLKQKITIRHVLNHTTCLQASRTTEEIYRSPDFVQLALCADVEAEPGTRFFYNNKAVNLLTGIVHRLSGLDLVEFTKRQIFEPLEISEFTWARDSAGNPHAFAGLALVADDLLKVGEMIVGAGEWRGRRVLQAATISRITAAGQLFDDGCGLLWWRKNEPGFRCFYASGYLGQALVVLPEHGIVAVRQIHWNTAHAHGGPELKSFAPEVTALARELLGTQELNGEESHVVGQ